MLVNQDRAVLITCSHSTMKLTVIFVLINNTFMYFCVYSYHLLLNSYFLFSHPKMTIFINIRRVTETEIVSVRKRNIQGRYNSVRHLQRRYLELPVSQLGT